MYNNPYLSSYSPQANIERINNQIAELEKMKSQMPTAPQQHQPTSINQTFQLSPNNQTTMRYVNSIDDVNKEFVIGDTPFFSKDLSVMWIKNPKGDVKSYEIKEIVQKDEKDLMIESLQLQLDELKEVINNARADHSDVDEPVKSTKSTSVSKSGTTKKK